MMRPSPTDRDLDEIEDWARNVAGATVLRLVDALRSERQENERLSAVLATADRAIETLELPADIDLIPALRSERALRASTETAATRLRGALQTLVDNLRIAHDDDSETFPLRVSVAFHAAEIVLDKCAEFSEPAVSAGVHHPENENTNG